MKRLSYYLTVFGAIFSLQSSAYASSNESCKVKTRHTNGTKALEICVVDRDGDGYHEAEIKKRHTPSGNIRKIEYDYNKDGSADRVSEWRFDTINGKEMKHAWYLDRDGDGTYDSAMRWKRSFNGRVLRRAFDNNNDGIDDEVLDYFYDNKGKLVKKSKNGIDIIAEG